MQRAYTSAVMGPAHLAAGLAGAAAFGAGTAAAGWPAWVTVPGVTAIVAAAIHVSVVRLSIGAGRIVVGQGPWSRRARVIPVETVTSAADEDLGWPQVFGFGVRLHRKTGRLTVRPGPTLYLQLAGGEHLRISTQDPAAARSLLPAAGKQAGAGKKEEKDE
jgi:hypothetical protein